MLSYAGTKPQTLMKRSIHRFVPLSCAADQNPNRGFINSLALEFSFKL
jgi:hypothetical protein